jgi:6-phosphogluconolactonase (cycloisomerase 2 family)
MKHNSRNPHCCLPRLVRKNLFMVLATLSALIAPAMLAAASPAKPADSPIYVITNDDATRHSYASFYVAGGSLGSPTLTYQLSVNTHGLGIGGGFFGTPRLAMLPSSSAQCLYASDAGTGDIAAINIQSQQLVGNFSGSSTDSGTTNGIGIVVNQNYLYAGYTESNTIATFSVGAGCQLSFLGDIAVAPLNGGWIAGMALNGNMLVAAYIDGSIQSFNVANGIPISNNDEQNSFGYVQSFFPDGVDITQDGHFAIFADAAVPTVVEVSDLSSGKLAPTVMYVLGEASNSIGPGVNSATLRLSPDETLIYLGNSQSGNVSAAFFNKNNGRVSSGCTSTLLNNFYNPWSYVGTLATRDTTGTGNVLYAAEFGSSIGILNVTSNGSRCTLTEAASSPVTDNLSPGLLSIEVFPPRPF